MAAFTCEIPYTKVLDHTFNWRCNVYSIYL